jgi:pyruvate/2-oxoacid:ferredoxin oxidoreductase alpha subunit
MKKVIMGNHALSYGAMLARSEVIAAYPITPQTQVVELLSEMCADGSLKAKFIKVESEHSAMAACIGASIAGARTFTATSSQGLALMHEMLHWASGGRLPVVMGNVNRSMAPGWSIWTDQNDSLSQRDTGWMQFYCASNQEVLDTTIQAFKVSEALYIPSMVVLDAFALSHTYEVVDVPDQGLVDRYLPKFKPYARVTPAEPHAFGGLTGPEHYFELRYKLQKDMERAIALIEETGREYEKTFGRRLGLVRDGRIYGPRRRGRNAQSRPQGREFPDARLPAVSLRGGPPRPAPGEKNRGRGPEYIVRPPRDVRPGGQIGAIRACGERSRVRLHRGARRPRHHTRHVPGGRRLHQSP